MSKAVHDDVLDGAHDIIRSNATTMIACSAQPTTRTEGGIEDIFGRYLLVQSWWIKKISGPRSSAMLLRSSFS